MLLSVQNKKNVQFGDVEDNDGNGDGNGGGDDLTGAGWRSELI